MMRRYTMRLNPSTMQYDRLERRTGVERRMTVPLAWLIGLVTGLSLPVIAFGAWCVYVWRRDTRRQP